MRLDAPVVLLVLVAASTAPLACSDVLGIHDIPPPPDAEPADVGAEASSASDALATDGLLIIDASWLTDAGAMDGADSADAMATGDATLEAGPPAALATGLFSPIALAVDSTNVYFLERNTPVDDSGSRGRIRRCPLAGCGAASPEVVVVNVSLPDGMAMAGTTLFWSDTYDSILSCDVGTVPCAGTQFAPVPGVDGGSGFPAQLWATATHLYWFANLSPGPAIQTCPLAGCTSGYPKTVLDGSVTSLSGRSTSGLAIDDQFAYATLFTGGPILRYAMSGAEAADPASEMLVGNTAFGTHDIDLDGTGLRWAESTTGVIEGCTAPSCAAADTVVSGRVGPYAIRHDSSFLYGGDLGASWNAGVLWRAMK